MSIIETHIDLGKVYRDKVSGYRGVAVAITKWQCGSVRITLQPNKLMGQKTFDDEALEEIKNDLYVKSFKIYSHYPSEKFKEGLL